MTLAKLQSIPYAEHTALESFFADLSNFNLGQSPHASLKDLLSTSTNSCALNRLYEQFRFVNVSLVEKQLALSLREWSGLELRCVPLIAVNAQHDRLLVYQPTSNPISFSFALDLQTKAQCIHSTGSLTKFRRRCHEIVVSSTFPSDQYLISLGQVLSHQSNGIFLLRYELPNLPAIYLVIQRCNINNRDDEAKTNTAVGTKFKLEVLENDKVLAASPTALHCLYHQICRHFAVLVHAEAHILGLAFYAYRYRPCFDSFGCTIGKPPQQRHCLCINYDPGHPMESVGQYYTYFAQSEIERQQNEQSPPHKRLHAASASDPHTLYLGLIQTLNAVSSSTKETVCSAIFEWATSRTHGVWHDSETRSKGWKWFSYVWPCKWWTKTQVDAERKIADGLRRIDGDTGDNPPWIQSLVAECRASGFVAASDVVNQLSANIYYNPHEDKDVYVSLDPHREFKKYGIVYSLSFQSSCAFRAYLAFNLKMNKFDGDLRVLLPDCSGLKMHSSVRLHSHRFCCKHVWVSFAARSWAGTIATHSISSMEVIIPPKQWRISVLLREIEEETLSELHDYYESQKG